MGSDRHHRAELLDPPERIGQGELILTDRPGFGIELNERTAARYSV